MPSTSKKQHRLMEAAAHTPGGFGSVPQTVGRHFVAADAARKVHGNAGRRRDMAGRKTRGSGY